MGKQQSGQQQHNSAAHGDLSISTQRKAAVAAASNAAGSSKR